MSINDSVSLFYGAKTHIFENAKMLRQNMTYSEQLLWKQLKKKALGLKFRSQHPIDIFIADFYCHPIKLVIEIDGEIHNSKEQREYDIGRTAELERFGIKIIRFTNKEVANNIEQVVKDIEQACINSQKSL